MAEILEERLLEAPPDVLERILAGPQDWLDRAAGKAGERGELVYGELGAEFGRGTTGARLHKRVRMQVGRPERLWDRMVIPLTWEAAGFSGLFPVMDALIELHRKGPDRTRLVFWGRYDPPLGRVGDLVDRLVAHRVAEATVRGLLAAIEERQTRSEDGKAVGTDA